jgi:hypothetical protein
VAKERSPAVLCELMLFMEAHLTSEALKVPRLFFTPVIPFMTRQALTCVCRPCVFVGQHPNVKGLARLADAEDMATLLPRPRGHIAA